MRNVKVQPPVAVYSNTLKCNVFAMLYVTGTGLGRLYIKADEKADEHAVVELFRNLGGENLKTIEVYAGTMLVQEMSREFGL